MSTRKILMLHGYAQNATILSKRMGAIRKLCGKDVDFVFIDAPHILHPVDLTGLSSNALNAPEATLTNSEPQSNPEEIARGWWRANAERTKYDGVPESLSLMRDILAKDRYEGVFGFSQGASMAALLSAVLERPQLHPAFLIDGQPPHPPFTFCVAVSGFKPLEPTCAPFFSPPYDTPTLHVVGVNDVVVTNERSKTLIDVSANARVVVHNGGHFIPSKTVWRNFFRDYFLDPLGDVPAPPMATSAPESLTPATSAPASGTATPINADAERDAKLGGESGTHL